MSLYYTYIIQILILNSHKFILLKFLNLSKLFDKLFQSKIPYCFIFIKILKFFNYGGKTRTHNNSNNVKILMSLSTA